MHKHLDLSLDLYRFYCTRVYAYLNSLCCLQIARTSRCYATHEGGLELITLTLAYNSKNEYVFRIFTQYCDIKAVFNQDAGHIKAN